MDNYLIAVIIGIVEGITEFLPISSTGHMILVGHLLGFKGDKAETFEVCIQLGAILSVLLLYRHRFFALFAPLFKGSSSQAPVASAVPGAGGPSAPGRGFHGWNGILLLALTTLPALVAGKFAHGYIKDHLFNPITVALGLGIGGLALILIEYLLPQGRKHSLDELSFKDALLIGCFQCFALWPGVSRSASTMVGGMLFGIDRKVMAEYSFLAAVPVMFAATGYDLYKSASFLEAGDLGFFAVGFVTSFIFACLAIKLFIRFLARYTLKGFGIYRIVLAGITLWYFSGRTFH